MTAAAEVQGPAPGKPPLELAEFVTFWEFFSEFFIPLNEIVLPLKDFHREICDKLELAFFCELGPDVRFVLINMPPRTGKTKILEAWFCWIYAYFPDAQNIFTSYSGDLAEASLSYVKETMMRPWFRENFGDVLHSKKADLMTTVDGGKMHAEGTGGTLTGKGAGLKRECGGAIAIDDPAKPDEALSVVVSTGLKQWLHTTIERRRNAAQFTPIVISAQKLGSEDLPGYVKRTYPANMIVEIKVAGLVDPKTGAASIAADAVSRIPETMPTSDLQQLKATRIGRFVLATQYQQEDATLGGNLIPVDSFHRYDPRAPMKFEKTVICCDTALKTKQANDFSALTLWGLKDRKAYLVDLMHGKWETPDLVANSIAFWKKWSAPGVGESGVPRPRFIIEEKAAGTPLLQTLNRAGVPATGIERDIDKVRRVNTVLPYIETGMVVVPKDDSVPWIAKFLTECAQFAKDGTHAHDDMVDTMVDAIEHLLGRATSIFDVLLNKKPS